MKNNLFLLLCFCLLSACSQEAPKENKQTEIVEKNTASEPIALKEEIVISPYVESSLVNNTTPIPKGYEVDTTHLKQPMLIDFNGDGKLDAFRILKNPNKSGMKYLFEFRIADSDKVYFYENDDDGYDLDTFGDFQIAKKGEKFINLMADTDEEIEPFNYDKAPINARILLKNDAITVNVLEETCGTSLFYLENEQIKRAYLC